MKYDEKVLLVSIFLIEEKVISIRKKIKLWFKYKNPEKIAKEIKFFSNPSWKYNLEIAKDKIVQKKCITVFDKEYPFHFNSNNIVPPSPVLFIKGNKDLLKNSKLFYEGIVGSRNIHEFSKRYLEFLIDFLNKNQNVVIVSGFAKGVDYFSHKYCIEKGIPTIGVLGCGIDIIYPKTSISLYSRIDETNSLLISEYPDGTLPLRFNFPFRNRIISLLSERLFLIQAGKKSGSLITAKYSKVLGKEIYVPNYPDIHEYNGNKNWYNCENVKKIIFFKNNKIISKKNELLTDNKELYNDLKLIDFNCIQKKILTTILFNPYISFTNLLENNELEIEELIKNIVPLLKRKIVIESYDKHYLIELNKFQHYIIE